MANSAGLDFSLGISMSFNVTYGKISLVLTISFSSLLDKAWFGTDCSTFTRYSNSRLAWVQWKRRSWLDILSTCVQWEQESWLQISRDASFCSKADTASNESGMSCYRRAQSWIKFCFSVPLTFISIKVLNQFFRYDVIDGFQYYYNFLVRLFLFCYIK